MFYVDDSVLISDSVEGMTSLIRAAEEGAAAVGLTFKPAKCASLHFVGENGALPTQFPIQGNLMPALRNEEAYEHLGISIGYQVRQVPVNTLIGLIADANAIDGSLRGLTSSCREVPLRKNTFELQMGVLNSWQRNGYFSQNEQAQN